VPEPDEGVRNRWIARAAYAALGAALVVGLARRPNAKRAETRTNQPAEPREKSPDEIFGFPPPTPPFTVSPNASRSVRWCTVRAVIERNCLRCHGSPLQFGAPFPLLTYADTQREFPSGSGDTLALRMSHAIRHRVMPPTSLPLEPPVLPLEPADRDVLLSWVEEGALALGGEDCAPAPRRL
jgi:hypothetical protein